MEVISVVDEDFDTYVALVAEAGIQAVGYADADALVDARPATEILLGDPVRMLHAAPRLPELRWMQSTWAGVERFVAAGVPAEVSVTRAAGVFGPAMREFVVGHLLEPLLDVCGHAAAVSWRPTPAPLLDGARVGILGTGTIGAAIAAALGAFGVDVVGCSRSGRPLPGFAAVFSVEDIHVFAEGLDHLVAVLPATAATDGLVDGAVLDRLRPGAVFVSVGRGQSVVTADVVAAVRTGKLRRAILDVLPTEPLATGDPLWSEPGVVITSHTAAVTRPPDVIPLFVDNLERWRTGRPLVGLVDFDAGY